MAAPGTEPHSRKHNSDFVPDRRLADHLGTTDPSLLIQQHLLSSPLISRASLFSKDDFLPFGKTRAPIKAEPDEVRKVYDGLLMGQRAATGDPTGAIAGGPPERLDLEGKAWEVEDINSDNLRAKGPDGCYLLVGATATMVVIIETEANVNPDSATTALQSFQSALTALPQGQAL